ncbi:MAG: EAL domain-containing protein [Betaproteobacteria bacterium]|nr:EAL domain-containing protein [Betaproteobacteria bacterium]
MTPQPPAAIERPRERERLLLYLIPGLAALLVVTLFTLAFLALAKSRDASLRDAERTTRNLAQIVEQRTAAMLQSVDATLRGLGEMWLQMPALRDPAGAGMHTLLAQKLGQLPNARTLFVLDARGMLVQDSDIHPVAPRDFSDRDYFNWHRSHSGRLYVGKPIVERGNGAWSVTASRRLDDAEGRFAGAIVVALEPGVFQSIYRDIEVGRDGVIGLMHEDGELIASAPEAPSWLGVPTGGNLTLKDLLSSHGSRTSRSVSAVDGVARIYSARRVADTPLMVQVGLSEEEVLAGWREEKKVTVVILIAFTLATMMLAWLLMQELRRRNDLARSVAYSEQMLRQVLDTLPVGVRVADSEGHLVLGNTASRRIWGASPAQGSPHSAGPRGWRSDSGEPLEAADWGMARALANGETSRNEVVDIECFDGSRKTILHSAAPIVSAEGEIVGGVAADEDITERRVLADTLRESEARYQALFEHSIDAVFLMQPDGSILSANAQACRLLGYTENELRALGRRGLTEPDDPRVAALLDEHQREGAARGELKMRRKDGSWVPVEVSSTTFRDRSGELCASVIIRDITDRKRAEEHIEYLAYHDELTGIPNRAHFQRAFEHTIAASRRQGLNCALMVVDLDRFKNINDIIGHEAGDQLLKQVAARLHTCLRDGDVLARLGGDEFVILMQDASSIDAVSAVANKILEATSRPLVIDEQEFLITASIGISTSPHDGTDLQTLLRNSDVAMYRAKESGKNGFQYFSPDMDAHGRERLSIESALGRALERREFMLHFQPKMQMSSRNVAGMEALVRWHNPEKGLMQPGDFIAIAEETGMIVPIGDWVLTEACRQGQALRASGHGNLRVAVNLSVRQLYDEGLAMRVSQALAQTGFPAENLELEITESMVMRDAEGAIKLLQALRDTGVRIAIDDFGTGYSSLAYLKRFPIDCVKIDRSFIRDLPDDRDDASITRSIIAMAHNMKLEVVAEGVETVPQLDFLHAHGCDEIQGFLFSKPLGIDAFELFLDRNAEQAQGRHLHS